MIVEINLTKETKEMMTEFIKRTFAMKQLMQFGNMLADEILPKLNRSERKEIEEKRKAANEDLNKKLIVAEDFKKILLSEK